MCITPGISRNSLGISRNGAIEELPQQDEAPLRECKRFGSTSTCQQGRENHRNSIYVVMASASKRHVGHNTPFASLLGSFAGAHI